MKIVFLKSLGLLAIIVYMIAGILLKNTSVRETHGIAMKNLGRLTFSRKFF